MCRELARNDQPVIKRFTPVLTLVALCWLVFVVNSLLWSGLLNQYGIVPRHLGSLPGILWAPFLHSSLKHLVANTVPLVILGAMHFLGKPYGGAGGWNRTGMVDFEIQSTPQETGHNAHELNLDAPGVADTQIDL
jgi:hypothetical protein